MPEVTGIEKLFSLWAKKKALRFNQLGTFQMGHSWLGDEDFWWMIYEFGTSVFGISKYADVIPISGIYRTDNVTGETKNYREPYYITKNPRTDLQQTNRAKMAAAVLAYQGLTLEERVLYYKRAIGKRLSGYNLFLREYLKSH